MTDGFDMEFERKKGNQSDYKIHGLSKWNNRVTIPLTEIKTGRPISRGEDYKEIRLQKLHDCFAC